MRFSPASTDREGAKEGGFYPAYVLTLLSTVYFLYLLDRTAIMITQELIKAEFRLSDTQMGLLIGAVYGISYGLAGLPIGWLVDRLKRRNMLVFILSVWSGLTAACGLSSSYLHLLIVRVGVGATEAGGAPTSLSILSDLYPPERRATVSSIFFSGTNVGMIVSFFVGGLVAREFGWRAVFLLYGLPGLLLALVILLTVREPVRHGRPVAIERREGILRSAARVLSTPYAGGIYIGSVLYSASTAAFGGWMIAFLMRTHHLDVATAGTIIAATLGVCGIVGTVAVGILADRARARGVGGPMLVVGGTAFVSLLAATVALHAADLRIVVAALAVYGLTVSAYAGPTVATLSHVVAPINRGMAFALYTLLANLVGGMGPLIVGMISDGPAHGQLAIAIQVMLLVNLAGGLCCLWVGKALNRQQAAE